MIAAVDPEYFSALEDENLGFANVTAVEIEKFLNLRHERQFTLLSAINQESTQQ